MKTDFETQHFSLCSINTSENRYRFYNIALEQSLFGDFLLLRNYGRIGRRGKTRGELFKTYTEAEKELEKVLKVRRLHGYVNQPPHLVF